jgi:hypothetical protein
MRRRSVEVSGTASALQAGSLVLVMLGAFAVLAHSMAHSSPSATAQATAPGMERPVAMP